MRLIVVLVPRFFRGHRWRDFDVDQVLVVQLELLRSETAAEIEQTTNLNEVYLLNPSQPLPLLAFPLV